MGGSIKRDRTARLVRVAHLLYQHPRGLSAREIAHRTGVSHRTVNRDLRALDEEIGVPVWEEGGRYGTEAAGFLPPLSLTLPEAVTLFLSARLMARYEDKRDRHVLSAFGKLATVLPAPIAQHVHATIPVMASKPRDESYEHIFGLLAMAWAEGRRVKIGYPFAHPDGRVFVNERTVAPYYLEPNPGGHSCYLIAHDGFTDKVRTFKVERIQRAELTDEPFEIPPTFDASSRLASAWTVSDEEPVEVRIRFHDPEAAARARENRWHSTQRASEDAEGRLELAFTVGGITEITPWVLSWGDAVEVLGPAELRARVARTAVTLADRYGGAEPTGAH
jgi:proteasome accessory factor B